MRMLRLLIIIPFLISTFAFAKKNVPLTRALKRAEQKMNVGEYEEAEKLYKKILEKNETEESALLGLGESYYWQGDYAQAVKTFDKILKQNPDHVEALNKQGKTYLALGDETKARRCFEHAKRIDPESGKAETLGAQVTRKTRVRIMGGYLNESLNYAADTQGEFQDLSIAVEKFFGIGIYNSYVNRFEKRGFNTLLYGYYYPLENTRLSLRASTAGKIAILPRQSYQFEISQHIGKWRPEIGYLFQDFQEADTHNITAALYVAPTEILELGGGYKFKALKATNREDEFHGGFSKLRLGTPFQWLSFNALYEYNRNGFEAGRTPTPFVTYKSHLLGGGLSISLGQAYIIEYHAFYEDRNNGENALMTNLSFGYGF